MKTLIVEDDLCSRMILQDHLKEFGVAHIAVNGLEAIESVRLALEAGEQYNLICMDIMMPRLGGQDALNRIRGMEEASGLPHNQEAKIVMTTALNDLADVTEAYAHLCDAYLVKPILKTKLLSELRSIGLLK